MENGKTASHPWQRDRDKTLTLRSCSAVLMLMSDEIAGVLCNKNLHKWIIWSEPVECKETFGQGDQKNSRQTIEVRISWKCLPCMDELL